MGQKDLLFICLAGLGSEVAKAGGIGLNILLTGHAGFIGRIFRSALGQDWYHAEEPLSLPRVNNLRLYEWGQPLPNLEDISWVIHCGALSSTTETDVQKVMAHNWDFSCWLLDQCIERGIHFQFSSSASIYGLLGNERRAPQAEASQPDPRTPYAWSKYMFEKYALSRKSNSLIQCFRYFNVYGNPEDEKHKGNQASPHSQFHWQATREGKIKVFENSSAYVRDFVNVQEVVWTQMQFLRIPESGVWNIGTGCVRSFMDVAMDTIDRLKGSIPVQLETIPIPQQLQHSYQTFTQADRTKLDKILGKYGLGRWQMNKTTPGVQESL